MTEELLTATATGQVVHGQVTYATVLGYRELGEQAINEAKAVTFDFSEATRCDSSVLTLVLVWQRYAQKLGKKISFINLPKSTRALADLCGLHEF